MHRLPAVIVLLCVYVSGCKTTVSAKVVSDPVDTQLHAVALKRELP